MPAWFEIEALKCQAICARTYTLRRAYSPPAHPGGASVCDDVNHCQAYLDPDVPSYQKYKLQRIREAVAATRGEVLVYRGHLINAVYHSTCGGRTASAQEMWGEPIPYLISVDCRCSIISPHRISVQSIPASKIARVFGAWGVKPASIRVVSRTATGRADKIQVGRRRVDASEFRRRLNLPSTFLDIQPRGKQVLIRCQGYGHGVGLCQYGANALALTGRDYRSILAHYYPGTELYRLVY